MFRTIGVLICAGAIVQPFASMAIAAEPTAPEPSSAALACAKRYNKALHVEETMAGLMKGMLPAIIEQERLRSGHGLTTEQETLIAEAMVESTAAMAPEMLDRLAPAMAATFTERELCALADFYGSTEGQTIIAKMPAYSAASSQAMMDFMPIFQRDMLARLCQKLDCNATPSTKRPTRTPS